MSIRIRPIRVEEITEVINAQQNNKAPCIDRVCHITLKALTNRSTLDFLRGNRLRKS